MNSDAMGAGLKQGELRVHRLRALMDAQGVDVIICMKPENTFYLSGFNPIMFSHPVVAILPRKGPLTLLVHALRDDHARASAWVSDIKLYGAWSTKVTMGLDWLKVLGGILEDMGVAKGRIGIEEDFLPMQRVKALQSIAPNAEFSDVSKAMSMARLVKEPSEIANARIAAKLADIGVETAIASLASGGSERSAAMDGQAAMTREWVAKYPDIEVCAFGSLEGGVQNALWTWVLAGEHVMMNCDNPTNRVPARGEIAIVFAWGICNGIYVENERSVAIGTLPEERKRAFEAVLELREKTAPIMGPGLPVAELFNTAVTHYKRLGYEANIPGRIGHGMGLGAHEEPSIDGKSKLILEPGMMFTFEPNLRVGNCGIQHSDTILITEGGFEYLTDTPRGYREIPA